MMSAVEEAEPPPPDEVAASMQIRGLPPSSAMTIRRALPGPTTVQYATAAHEWLSNPVTRQAVCKSLDEFMLQPSTSTLFTSSFNPPIASYYANEPDASLMNRSSSNDLTASSSTRRGSTQRHSYNPYPHSTHSSTSQLSFFPSDSDSTLFDDQSTTSYHLNPSDTMLTNRTSSDNLVSSSSNRRKSTKRRSFAANPYPASSSTHRRPSYPDNSQSIIPDNPSMSSQTAQAGPSSFPTTNLSPTVLSPLPMALDPSPALHQSSPMAWSPPSSSSSALPQDIFPLDEYNLDHLNFDTSNLSLNAAPSTSALPMLSPASQIDIDFPYEVYGVDGSTDFLPLVPRLRSKVALDDSASMFSANTVGSSGVGTTGDLNRILRIIFAGTGNIFDGVDFLDTDYIKGKTPNVAGVGKHSRTVSRANSFRGIGWSHMASSIHDIVSASSKACLDIFCRIQTEHVRLHNHKRPLEPYDFETAKSLLFAINIAPLQLRNSMQTAFKLSFAMSIINGWDAFHRDVGEKLTYGKLVKACNAVSDQLSSLVQDPRGGCKKPVTALVTVWLSSFFYTGDKCLARKLRNLVTSYPELFAAWSPEMEIGDQDGDDDSDEERADKHQPPLCPFLHYIPPSTCFFSQTLLKATVVELVAIVDMEGYKLDDEVTYILLLDLLNRPRNMDIENKLFVQFYDNIGKSFRGNPLEMKILRSELNSLARMMLKKLTA